MKKKTRSETDIRSNDITRAIVQAGWDLQTQIREEVALAAGKIGSRAATTNADRDRPS